MLPGMDASPLKREFKRLMKRAVPAFIANFFDATTQAAARAAIVAAQYGDADQIAVVGGTADALTLAFTPAWTALNGGIFQFVAAPDNATTTPTGNPNGLGAKTFIKGNDLPLALGDIKSGMTMLARYDSVLGKLALLNPATGVTVAVIPDGSVTPAKLSQPLTRGTAVNTTSGTVIDFTGIPSWVKKITVVLNGVSTNGTSNSMVQIGSTTIATSGYLGNSDLIQNASSTIAAAFTTGFGICPSTSAASVIVGQLTLILISGTTWIATFNGSFTNSIATTHGGGVVTLGSVLDRIRLTTVNGTDTFDLGSVNIYYE